MTLSQIIKDVALRHGVPTALVGGFVREAIEELASVVDSGVEVKVRGLGTFRWKKVKGKAGTGALKNSVPDGWKLRFLPSRRYRGRRKQCQTKMV